MASSPPTVWWDHAHHDQQNYELLGVDGAFHSYDELLALADTAVLAEITAERWQSKHAEIQRAIETLKDDFAGQQPDIAIIVGDDELELFSNSCLPAFAVHWGPELTEYPPSTEEVEALSPSLRAALWAEHGEQPEAYACSVELGRHLIEYLMESDFDVAQTTEQHPSRSVGHAFTFVRRRIMADAVAPILPVFVNTYYPPNQPSPRRCFQLGQALRRGVESWSQVASVAIVASGGLSHFVVNEELDRHVLDCLERHDADGLMSIPRRFMRSGTSEVLNWLVLAGATEKLELRYAHYIAGYRSPAGTGIGLAFAHLS